MSGAKQYVDRATQTEAQESLSGLVLGPSVSAERPSNTAYTHWPSLTTLSEESSSLSPSASTPHRISKPPQLLYNRPVEPHALAKRIVSLPESSSCDSLRRTVHDVAGIRIVSLPEPIRCSPQSRDSSSYLDSFGTSADPSLASLGSDFGHLKFRSYPRDVPRTPSPPSSPSSILIIDNEVHLPSYQQHKNSVTEHDGGWITWASSPPRPIPALHGPSSLPYARCPSGAEGIIIEEDADLPRMVWGLTLEGLPSSDTRKQRTINVHKPTTVNFQSTLQAARQIPQVQLSSAIYSPNSEICLPASRHNYSADAVLRRSPALEGVNRSTSRDSAIQFLGPPLDQHHMHNMQENRAVNWREPSYISASKIKTINERPSSLSASIFVPAASKHGCPRTTTEFCAPTLVKPRTLAAIDIARQYCLDQQKNTLPTPPTSSSPQWSPVLPGHAPFSQLREERNFLDDQQASELSPARTRSGIDPLEEQQLVGSPPAGRGLGLRDVPPPLSSWTRRYSPSNQFPQKSCKTTLSSGPPPSTSLYPSNIHRTADLTSTGTSDPHPPLERRVSVSRTHPKQWRLPSVVEEDSGTGLNNVSLCVQSRPHVYAALRGTSRRTTHISDSDHPFTGFDDFSPTAADIAKVAFDPNSGPQFETPCITLAQNIKPAMESTPTVKLPLSTAFLGRQDEVGVREAKGTRFDNEKENTSNVKTRDKSVLKRGRARKRNMNTKLDDSQNKMPK